MWVVEELYCVCNNMMLTTIREEILLISAECLTVAQCYQLMCCWCELWALLSLLSSLPCHHHRPAVVTVCVCAALWRVVTLRVSPFRQQRHRLSLLAELNTPKTSVLLLVRTRLHRYRYSALGEESIYIDWWYFSDTSSAAEPDWEEISSELNLWEQSELSDTERSPVTTRVPCSLHLW